MRYIDENVVAFVGNTISVAEKDNGRAFWDILKDASVGTGI